MRFIQIAEYFPLWRIRNMQNFSLLNVISIVIVLYDILLLQFCSSLAHISTKFLTVEFTEFLSEHQAQRFYITCVMQDCNMCRCECKIGWMKVWKKKMTSFFIRCTNDVNGCRTYLSFSNLNLRMDWKSYTFCRLWRFYYYTSDKNEFFSHRTFFKIRLFFFCYCYTVVTWELTISIQKFKRSRQSHGKMEHDIMNEVLRKIIDW